MKIWLESTDLALIEKGARQGVVDGVVTTPSLLAENPKKMVADLLAAQSGPVIVDVIADFQKIKAPSSRIILRLPAAEEAWETIHHSSTNNIPVMVGAIFTPTHALLAAKAGATYIAPHLSRMLKTGERPFEQIESIQKIITQYHFPTDVMVLHPKSIEQVKACAEIGVAGMIIRDDFYRELIETHELASFHVEQSMDDWKKSVELFSSTD